MTVIAVLVSASTALSGRRCFSDGGCQSAYWRWEPQQHRWTLPASVAGRRRMPGGWSGAARIICFYSTFAAGHVIELAGGLLCYCAC